MRIPLKLRLLLLFRDWFSGEDTHLTPAAIRENNKKELRRVGNFIDFPPIPLLKITNHTIEMRDGHGIPIRIYQPSDSPNLPLIVYYHGGGFVLRDIDSHDRVCRRIAHVNDAVVISIGYRLAPEWKFPTPHQDCYDATVWAAQNASTYGANTEKIVVMGDSAGGNLATVVARMARDLGTPKITAQVLIYPTSDARLDHPSIEKYSKGYLLTKELIQWFISHYKSKDSDILDPNFSPLLAADLTNMPPAYIFTAEYDPLKDEGKAYSDKLKSAGNEVIYKEFGGMIHGFFNMPKFAKSALVAHEEIRDFLKPILK